MKRDRHLTKALETLYLEIPDDVHSVNDIKAWISDNRMLLEDLKNGIEQAKEQTLKIQAQNDTLSDILRQIEIEKYQELNPGRNVMMLK